eukprot:scaffold5966_cov118-Cylindrotheca_fusiformis.AAC.5
MIYSLRAVSAAVAVSSWSAEERHSNEVSSSLITISIGSSTTKAAVNGANEEFMSPKWRVAGGLDSCCSCCLCCGKTAFSVNFFLYLVLLFKSSTGLENLYRVQFP